MKRLFNPSSMFEFVRLALAGTCVLTATALALVATANIKSSGSVSKGPVIKSTAHDSLSAAYEISNKDGNAEDPTAAAADDYANRAYPGPDEIDLGALINAQAGLQNFLLNATPTPAPAATATPTPPDTSTPPPTATPRGKNKKGGKSGRRKGMAAPAPVVTTSVTTTSPVTDEPPPLNFWQQVTGGTSTDPNVLTFTGSTQNVSGRITALALDTHNSCTAAFCRVWVGAAGGGIWRTTNALAALPTWTYVSAESTPAGFKTNAIGAITFFDNGTANGILLVGTGEPNASADSESGLGVFESTNGGTTWTHLATQIGPITTVSPGTGPNGTYTGNAFFGRSVSGIAVDPTNPSVLYISSARGVRGVTSTYQGNTSNPPTPRPPFGLFKSIDGGNTVTFIFDGSATCPASCLGGDASAAVRGANEVALDPSNHNTVYSSWFPGANGTGGGVWRSLDGGTTWTQIKSARNPLDNSDRCTFALNTLTGPSTRMYVGCGNSSTSAANRARVYRNDAVQTGTPVFIDLTALEVVPSTINYCSSQCWYDNVVYSPPGSPDVVYVGGSFTYGECGFGSDCRGVVMSQDAGASGIWNDMTWDAQNNVTPAGACCQPNAIAPNGIHPDQHALFTVPGNPLLFFEGSDGGIVRSDGTLTNISAQCAARTFPPGTGTLVQCVTLLGGAGGAGHGVPTIINNGMNTGLNTLQLQSISVAPDNVNHFQFGTQDNGTWNEFAFVSPFFQEIYGDGGQSGFNVGTSAQRFNSFFGQAHDANFQNGNPVKWVQISGPILFSPEGSAFYPPLIADPTVAGSIFEGSFHVWRTQDWGGSQAVLEATCPEFGPTLPTCGDFVPLGGVAGANDQGNLVGTFYTGRAGGVVNRISRTTSNNNTAWAATSAGRIFVSDNINAAAAAVVWTRIDAGGANGDPGRVPTGIAIDSSNPHHAWISYSGYNFNTPSQPGHIFSVTWSGSGAATWTSIDSNIWDVPLTDVAFDPVTGNIFVSSDFLVFRLGGNQFGQWFAAGLNMPLVEITGLTIIPSARLLYAATHGLGAWRLQLY